MKKKILNILFALVLALSFGLATIVPMSTPALAAPPPHLYEYYNTGGDVPAWIGGNVWAAQTFTPGTAHTITSVKLFLSRLGNPGTVTVGIRATNGSGDPTGTDLCSGTTDGSTLQIGPNYQWREITLGSGYNLSAGTQYAIVVRAANGITLVRHLNWLQDISSPSYAGGRAETSVNGGSFWTSWIDRDLMFEEWGDIAPVADPQNLSVGACNNLTVTLSGSDSDTEDNTLIYKISTLPTHDELYDGTGTGGTHITSVPYTVIDAAHNVTYQPDASYSGADSFGFKVNDGMLDSAEATISITVIAPPTADAGEDATICSGSSVQIGDSPTGSGGMGTLSYSWDPTDDLDDPTAANPYASPSATTTYTVTVTDNVSCSNSDNMTVTVNPKPTVIAGSPQQVCQGGAPIAIPDGTPSGGLWSGTGIVGSNFDPDDLPPGAYSIMYSYTNPTNGCSNSDNKTVTIVASCEGGTAPDVTVCQGTTLTDDLFAGTCPTGCGSPVYDYSSVDVNSPDDYSYTVTCSNSVCTDNTTGTVTVVASCEATAPDFSICQGTTVDDALFINHGADCSESCTPTLTYDFNSNSPPGDYPYSVTCSKDICEDGVTNNTNCRRVIVSDTDTMVTKGNGAMPHNAFFAWEPGPNYPNDGPDDSSWAANSLWDQNINYNFSSLGADWIWESYRVVNSVAGDVVYFQRNFNIPGTPTGATLHITCDNGYEAYINGNFIGSAQLGAGWETSDLTQPYVDTTNWQSVEPWTITADKLVSGTNVLLVKAANEQLTGGTTSSNPGGLIFELVYEFTDACCCSDNATGTVTINPLPACEITADDAVCAYSDNHTASGPADMDEYSWAIIGGTINGATNEDNVTYTAGNGSPPLQLSLTITSGTCSSTCTDNVTVDQPPACQITADDAVCAYSDNHTASGPADMDEYSWAIIGGTINGATNEDNVTYTAGNGSPPLQLLLTITEGTCSSTCTDNVTVNPLPVANAAGSSSVCTGGTIQLTGGPDGMISYSWTGPNGFTSTQQSPSISNATTAMTGTYTLTVTNGCGSSNATVSVSVVNCGGGGGGGGSFGISGGDISFETTAPTTTATCPLTLTVNMLGQITTAKMTSDGVLCENCLAFDPPKQNSWEAKAGTKLTLEGNKVPQLIKVTTAGSSPPSGPAETIGPTYNINAYASLNSTIPSAISISPLFTMASAYDPNELPENTSQVIFSYYPNSSEGWLAMGSEGVVAEVGQARGTLNYFVPDTLLAKLAEAAAKFEVSNLTINPTQTQPTQQVVISVNVANTGSTAGNYSVELKVNGITKSTKEVTVAAGTSSIVSFTTTEDAVGRYQVEIAGLKGEFVVAGPPSINWWLIGGIITAIILALAIWMLMRWRRFSG